MGHGKETPRQKMIGMMYLVLTALLALNVSKEVLNAFINIDEGINKSIENTLTKKAVVMADLAQKNATMPEKVGVLFHLANQVSAKSDSLVSMLMKGKKIIAKKAAGEDSDAVRVMEGLPPLDDPHYHGEGHDEDTGHEEGDAEHDEHADEGHEGEGGHTGTMEKSHHTLHLNYIDMKDNTDIPAEVMVGNPDLQNGIGFQLKDSIDAYREWLLGLQDDDGNPLISNPDLVRNIKKSLNTDPQRHGKEEHPWVNANFEHLPLAGVVSIMSGIENTIRNLELDLVNYLYALTEAGNITVNALDVIAQGQTDVLQNAEAYHEIFLAAYDSLAEPEVLICDYEETTIGGVKTYKPTDIKETLEIKNGRGMFKLQSGTTGPKSYKGLIRIKRPDGSMIVYPFEKDYRVTVPTAVVSPTKMNVFYIGVANPVEVSVPGVSTDKVKPVISQGRMVPIGPGKYNVFVNRVGPANITVRAELAEDDMVNMGTKPFRVKDLPTPIAKVGGKSGGAIQKAVLSAQAYVVADMEDFDFELTVNVTQFTVSAVVGGFLQEQATTGNVITAAQKEIINQVGRGQSVYFQGIKAQTPAGVKDLLSLQFKIQ